MVLVYNNVLAKQEERYAMASTIAKEVREIALKFQDEKHRVIATILELRKKIHSLTDHSRTSACQDPVFVLSCQPLAAQ